MTYLLADSTRLVIASLICLFMTVCALQTIGLMVCALERRRVALWSMASTLCQSLSILVAFVGFGFLDRNISVVALPLVALRLLTLPPEETPLSRLIEVVLLASGLAGLGLLSLHYQLNFG